MTGRCLAGMLIKSGDDISGEGFDVPTVEVTMHEARGVSNKAMVVHRVQPGKAYGGRQCAIADEVCTRDAGSCGIAVERRQLVGGEVDLDFRH